jgi:hypothetical protein
MKASGQLRAPAALSAGKELPINTGIRGYVGLGAGLDAVERTKIPSPRRESNPDRPAHNINLLQTLSAYRQ